MAAWRLRTSLSLLLAVTTAITFALVGAAIILLRVPQIEAEASAAVQAAANAKARLLEFYLRGLEAQLAPVALLAEGSSLRARAAMLTATVGDGRQFAGAYLVDADGIVRGAAFPPRGGSVRPSLVGTDLSRTPLFRDLADRDSRWSDKLLSASSGEVVIGVAVRRGQWTVIGEIAPDLLRETVATLAGASRDALLVVDPAGERLVDNGSGGNRAENLGAQPVVRAAFAATGEGRRIDDPAGPVFVGSARPANLGWTFIVSRPAGFANEDIRRTVLLTAGGGASALLIGLLLAIWWAKRLAQPVQRLIGRTHRLAAGRYDEDPATPPSAIAEINELDDHLHAMADAIRAREASLLRSETELESIFNASPVAMNVSDLAAGSRIVRVNEAWVKQFGRRPEDAVGRTGSEIGLWADPAERTIFLARFRYGPGVYDDLELWLKRADGESMLCRVSARVIALGGQQLLIMASADITEARHMATELRHVNEELEVRVEQRTAQLSQANAELAGALAHLRQAQDELVRAEKQAALGRLVAGVAHELNTPIGNALMAMTTLESHHQEFAAAMADGLRRSTLERFVADVGTAAGIATRNLERAAALIASFKQVAVDQASAQRRRFLLRQAVDELLTTLRPALPQGGHRIDREIPADLELDSYPGPLGQVLGNLVDNALRHAFPGRRDGRIRIVAERAGDDGLRVVVADDGIGIAEAHRAHIFDPFFTTRLGSGACGLGLNIVHNVVCEVLGGRVEVGSEAGGGTRFTLHLPRTAPHGACAATAEAG